MGAPVVREEPVTDGTIQRHDFPAAQLYSEYSLNCVMQVAKLLFQLVLRVYFFDFFGSHIVEIAIYYYSYGQVYE